MNKNIKKIAVLTCSYNRVRTTTAFLETVVKQQLPADYHLDLYLLDDRSPDKTAEHVKQHFPTVKIIMGSGSLFWAGGMRTLWVHVTKQDTYDFFLLLNDDVMLMDQAIIRLIDAHRLSKYPANIILGTVIDPSTGQVSYGGNKLRGKFTNQFYLVKPSDNYLKPCELGNGNIMLIDQHAFEKNGILSENYTHSLADFDYTLSALYKGIKVWVAPGYYGYCKNDHGANWMPQTTSLKKRIDYLYSPKGLAYKEYLSYISKYFPLTLPSAFLKLWLKTFFPFAWSTLKKNPMNLDKSSNESGNYP